MALLPGKDASIKLGSVIVARMINFNITINNETIDAIYFDSDWSKAVAGIQGWSATISGFMDLTDTTGQVLLKTAAEDHTLIDDIRFYVNADNYYSPDLVEDSEAGCYIESFTITADNGSLVAFDMSIKGNGPILYA